MTKVQYIVRKTHDGYTAEESKRLTEMGRPEEYQKQNDGSLIIGPSKEYMLQGFPVIYVPRQRHVKRKDEYTAPPDDIQLALAEYLAAKLSEYDHPKPEQEE